jgi:hypothetical protein
MNGTGFPSRETGRAETKIAASTRSIQSRQRTPLRQVGKIAVGTIAVETGGGATHRT